MRIAYLDCFAGIAGDMFLGALLDAGVPPQVLHGAAAALDLDASLKIERVDRSGISSTKVRVLEKGRPAEVTHSDEADAAEDDNLYKATSREHQHNTHHQHKTGQAHTLADENARAPAKHTHVHGRSLSQIRVLIQGAPP